MKEKEYADDVNELDECKVESDVDDFGEVAYRSDERIVTVKQVINQSHLVVTAQTLTLAQNSYNCNEVLASRAAVIG